MDGCVPNKVNRLIKVLVKILGSKNLTEFFATILNKVFKSLKG